LRETSSRRESMDTRVRRPARGNCLLRARKTNFEWERHAV